MDKFKASSDTPTDWSDFFAGFFAPVPAPEQEEPHYRNIGTGETVFEEEADEYVMKKCGFIDNLEEGNALHNEARMALRDWFFSGDGWVWMEEEK